MEFKDKLRREIYAEKGYLLVPFLSAEQLLELDKIVAKYYSVINKNGFFISNQLMDEDTSVLMNNEINAVIQESIDKYIDNAVIFFSVIASKTNSENSKLNIHTDRSIIDESVQLPINIWIPLCNVSKENGTLRVFEKSHTFTQTYRGINTYQYYLDGDYYDFIEKYCMKDLNVSRGDAVFYHSGMIHGSSVNNSDSIRNALLISMHPKNINTVYCYQRKRFNFFNFVDIYEADINYWRSNPQTDPKGVLKLIDRRRNTKPKITLTQLQQYIVATE
jgi:hypothetical protein